MALPVRRVVTGHNAQGRAVVLFDGTAENVISQRALQERCLIWTTSGFPINNDGHQDAGAIEVGTGLKGGTVFGIVKLDPGIAERHHRTNTIDYGVVLSGQLILELDDKKEVTLNAGDVFVQRGTMHCWHNRGKEPVVFAVSMVDAKAATAGGKTLEPGG